MVITISERQGQTGADDADHMAFMIHLCGILCGILYVCAAVTCGCEALQRWWFHAPTQSCCLLGARVGPPRLDGPGLTLAIPIIQASLNQAILPLEYVCPLRSRSWVFEFETSSLAK